MPQRLVQQYKALDALIRVYAPPRQTRILFWDLPELPDSLAKPAEAVPASSTGDAAACSSDSEKSLQEETCTNACNSRPLQLRPSQEEQEQPSPPASAAPPGRASRKDSKRLEQRRWVGSVVEALSDVFTAIWANFVEPSKEFQTASQLRPGSGRPGTDANLVSKAFSSDSLIASRESFRIHFRLMQEFKCEASLSDWESNSAVNAYIDYLKSDQMIRECCSGLFERLGTPGLETVDAFVDTLRQVWFQPVDTNAEKPRCGYYHVCIGEFHTRSRTLGGMHNWFKFLIEEEKHRTRILNWWSYEKDLHLVSMKFSMKHPDMDVWFAKPKSSFLIGVPTDFELLLFTVVTMVNPNRDTSIQIKDYEPLVVVPRTIKKTGGLVTAYFRESPKQIGS